jgi:hypothetical protein
VLAAGVEVMAATNAAAADALRLIGPTAVVDVTGFGLVGHLHNLVRESGCAAELDLATLPLIPGVRELVDADVIPGGSRRNRAAAAAYMTAADSAIDALVTLATNPFKYLVGPRIIAAVVTLPILVGIADVIGIMGGYIRWSGLVEDPSQAITVIERIAGRPLDPFGREVMLMAADLR